MNTVRTLSPWVQWTPSGRTIIFALSASSIWCLLAELYGLCSMRAFTLAILLGGPAIFRNLGGSGRVLDEALAFSCIAAFARWA